MHCSGIHYSGHGSGDVLHCRVRCTAGWKCTPLQDGDALHCRMEMHWKLTAVDMDFRSDASSVLHF